MQAIILPSSIENQGKGKIVGNIKGKKADAKISRYSIVWP
jgi:hypothetical protein